MGHVCNDLSELKLVVRCAVVATLDALTIEELWKKVIYVFGGPSHVRLDIFGYNSVFDFFKSIPDIVQVKLMLQSTDKNILHLMCLFILIKRC